MLIGNRLRELRESKKLTQRDVQKRTGLLCSYISRLENCQTVPSVPTLEKLARALEVPIYRLFYDGELLRPTKARRTPGAWGSSGKDARLVEQFRQYFSLMQESDRTILLGVARKLAKDKAARLSVPRH